MTFGNHAAERLRVPHQHAEGTALPSTTRAVGDNVVPPFWAQLHAGTKAGWNCLRKNGFTRMEKRLSHVIWSSSREPPLNGKNTPQENTAALMTSLTYSIINKESKCSRTQKINSPERGKGFPCTGGRGDRGKISMGCHGPLGPHMDPGGYKPPRPCYPPSQTCQIQTKTLHW